MNKWIGKGRLTRDPEVRYTQSGKAVATFTLACDRRKGKNAPKGQPTADFISCVAWEKLAETIKNYCGKGKELLVEGHLQTRSYDDKNGVKHYVTEAVLTNMEFCGSKNGGEQGAPALSGMQDVADEEIPF